MQCPNDGETLLMSNRQGVEIDYCPKCRGVWLDRGELDKIIEREAQEVAPPQASQRSPEPYREQRYDDDRDKYKYKKKKSLLGELFDF